MCSNSRRPSVFIRTHCMSCPVGSVYVYLCTSQASCSMFPGQGARGSAGSWSCQLRSPEGAVHLGTGLADTWLRARQPVGRPPRQRRALGEADGPCPSVLFSPVVSPLLKPRRTESPATLETRHFEVAADFTFAREVLGPLASNLHSGFKGMLFYCNSLYSVLAHCSKPLAS